jgi:hypothetical protein
MWKRFAFSVNLKDMIFKYFKLVELAIVYVQRNLKDEPTFSTITFVKFKLKNHSTTNLDLVVMMYA